jgi:hypothetical protein
MRQSPDRNVPQSLPATLRRDTKTEPMAMREAKAAREREE